MPATRVAVVDDHQLVRIGLKQIIESGRGWGFLPAHTIRKQVSTGRLIRVQVTGWSYAINLCSYHPQDRARSKTLSVFIELLKQRAD